MNQSLTDKILLACPVSQHKDYIIDNWLNYIKQFTHPYDLLLVDNSINPYYHKKFINMGIKTFYVNPADFKNKNIEIRNIEYITKSQDIIRNYCIENNYTHWFSLECDLFPPINTIEHFLGINKKVIGFPYFIGTLEYNCLMLQYPETKEFGNNSIVVNYSLDESFLFIDGSVRRAFSIGLGCVLIETEVLKQVNFRMNKKERVHADCYFYQDLFNKQIPVYCDTSHIVRHYNRDWSKVYNEENFLNNGKKNKVKS